MRKKQRQANNILHIQFFYSCQHNFGGELQRVRMGRKSSLTIALIAFTNSTTIRNFANGKMDWKKNLIVERKTN